MKKIQDYRNYKSVATHQATLRTLLNRQQRRYDAFLEAMGRQQSRNQWSQRCIEYYEIELAMLKKELRFYRDIDELCN